MSGGRRKRVMSTALSPPASAPMPSVQTAGSPGRNAGVAPEFAEEDGAEAEQRADGEIDAAGEDDGRHHQREQADFDRVAEDVEGVVERAEVAADGVEVKPFQREDEQEDGFVAEED